MLLLPQHFAPPPAVSAHVCVLPAVIAVTPLARPETSIGVRLWLVVPLPRARVASVATNSRTPVVVFFENEVVKSLTDMGYRATDVTRDRLIDGLARVEELSGGTLVKDVRDTGQKAVFQMNATLAKQILRQLTGG